MQWSVLCYPEFLPDSGTVLQVSEALADLWCRVWGDQRQRSLLHFSVWSLLLSDLSRQTTTTPFHYDANFLPHSALRFGRVCPYCCWTQLSACWCPWWSPKSGRAPPRPSPSSPAPPRSTAPREEPARPPVWEKGRGSVQNGADSDPLQGRFASQRLPLVPHFCFAHFPAEVATSLMKPSHIKTEQRGSKTLNWTLVSSNISMFRQTPRGGLTLSVLAFSAETNWNLLRYCLNRDPEDRRWLDCGAGGFKWVRTVLQRERQVHLTQLQGLSSPLVTQGFRLQLDSRSKKYIILNIKATKSIIIQNLHHHKINWTNPEQRFH